MTGYLDQYNYGWRYRVMEGSRQVAGSIIFADMGEALDCLHQRFPGMVIEKVVTHG